MAFTYNAVSNRIFVDPDSPTEDLIVTLDEVVTAYPAYVTKVNQTYFFTASLILCGTDTSRVELSATSAILYFTGSSLGNDGGRLILGEKGTTAEGTYTKDGCLVILDGSGYGYDPYKVSHSYSRDTTKEYPLCGEDGEVFLYDTKLNYINSTSRNDMLDMSSLGSEVEIIDCHFDGNGDYGGQSSYTHLFLVKCYFENVKISNFGTFELRYQTERDWVGVQLLDQTIGVSVFQAISTEPVRLKDLTLKGISFLTKKPGGSYLSLIDVNYTGSNWNSSGSSGWTKLISSVSVSALYDGNGLEGARLVITNAQEEANFDVLTDSSGNVSTQEVQTDYSPVGSTTFDIHGNPFIFHGFAYGKIPIEIPLTIVPPNKPSITGAFLADNNITQTAEYSEAIDVDLVANIPEGMILDQGFDSTLIYDDDLLTTGQWASPTTLIAGSVYTQDGVLFLKRDWSVNWNNGGVVYQKYSGWVIGNTYEVTVRILDMGDATLVRCGIDGDYDQFQMTAAGTYSFQLTATATDGEVILNSDPGTYTTHAQIDFFSIVDLSVPKVLPMDADGNTYSYTVDGKGNTINDVFHKLHHLWTIPHGPAVTANTPSGLTLDGYGNYHGGKGILFTNIQGKGLTTTTSDDGTVYSFPLSASLTLTKLQTGSDVVILEAGTNNVLDSVDQVSGTEFSYVYNALGNIDIGVIKAGYVTQYLYDYELTGVDSSLPITQLVDRNYL